MCDIKHASHEVLLNLGTKNDIFRFRNRSLTFGFTRDANSESCVCVTHYLTPLPRLVKYVALLNCSDSLVLTLMCLDRCGALEPSASHPGAEGYPLPLGELQGEEPKWRYRHPGNENRLK